MAKMPPKVKPVYDVVAGMDGAAELKAENELRIIYRNGLAADIFVALIQNKGTTASISDSVKRAFDAAEAFQKEVERRGRG